MPISELNQPLIKHNEDVFTHPQRVYYTYDTKIKRQRGEIYVCIN